jgi:hypothetical protein
MPTSIQSTCLTSQFIPVPHQKRGAFEKGRSEIGIV